MTNRPGPPDRTIRGGWKAGWTSPVWLLVFGVWLGSLLNLALNTATDTTKPYPGPLRWLQQYPWQAATLLTLLTAVLTWWQSQRTTASQPAGSGPLTGVLTLRQESVVTDGELAVLRRQLLEQVRRTWIEGVLHRSLAQVVRVELGLAEQPGAVDHPWRSLLVRAGQPKQALPPGTRIAALASRFDRHLLILGGPGAGKTTLLLEYAADLLEQAECDAGAPIPAVFHLSAWPAEQPPLEQWLVEELALRYGVSRRLAVELVVRDRLAVLLDGLDEVPQVRRAACVEAINSFRSEHGGMPLVVCVRSHDYQKLATRLILKGAVAVQPLDRGQVRRWLTTAGRPLAGVRAALRDRDHWLWELLNNPLLLSITALTYAGKPASAVRAHGSRNALLEAYVEAILARPRAPLTAQHQVAYADADTLRWLGWLAERLGSESVFYPDWMQPSWLPTRQQQWLITTGLGLITGLAVGLAVGLIVGLLFGLFLGVAAGVLAGLMAGPAMGLTVRSSRIEPIEPMRWSWSSARHYLRPGMRSGLGFGALLGLLLELARLLFGLSGRGFGQVGLLVGLGFGLVFCVSSMLMGGLESRLNVRPAAPLQGIRATAQTGRWSFVVGGLIGGLTGGLPLALAVGLTARLTGRRPGGLPGGLAAGLTDRLATVLVTALIAGLSCGLTFGLVFALLNGGASYLRYQLLVLLLRRRGLIPANLIDFLDYADSRILLRRVGGGYTFVHRLLQDYFQHRGHRAAPSPATATQKATTVK